MKIINNKTIKYFKCIICNCETKVRRQKLKDMEICLECYIKKIRKHDIKTTIKRKI